VTGRKCQRKEMARVGPLKQRTLRGEREDPRRMVERREWKAPAKATRKECCEFERVSPHDKRGGGDATQIAEQEKRAGDSPKSTTKRRG